MQHDPRAHRVVSALAVTRDAGTAGQFFSGIPATQAIYQRALKEGLLELFVEAEAAVSTPTCGPCLGGYMGILAAGERAISTTNRNFVGRMGDRTSEVYLAGPAVAAASAVAGRIVGPEEVL